MSDSERTLGQEDSARRTDRGPKTAHLRIVFGRASEAVHAVRSTGTTVGRVAGDSTCDVQVDDGRMSRNHVCIERNAAGWQLVDVGSRNGGFVDGRAIAPGERATLTDGTVIRLGDTLAVFRTSPVTSDGNADVAVFPGVSPAAVAVRRRIGALASAPGHVLVLGETGTGKERVARGIAERHGPYPFVTQNCAELTRELARSELFGHVRGAFSSAIHDKQGLVHVAREGVLFLDEIGELPLDVQGELLRFLEDGTYRPVGSVELKQTKARVIAATNLDIDAAVANNRFRRDLAARLRASNAPLELAPLRERREDIPRWIHLFLQEAGHPGTDDPWTVGALECLLLYPWLENLRELRGLVRALFAEQDRFPWPTDGLPARLLDHRSALRDASAPGTASSSVSPRDPTRIDIEQALRGTKGRVRSAAQQLGIDRRKLYRLCKRYGIELEHHRSAQELAK